MNSIEHEQEKFDDFENRVLPYLFSTNTNTYTPSGSAIYGGNKISYDLKKLIGYDNYFQPKSNSFVHFTSLQSLHSILNSLTLRMYSLGSVNDPEEYLYYANEFNIDSETANRIKNSTFLISACSDSVFKEKEILLMWEKYADNGSGCAIEFEIKNPKFIEPSNFGYSNIKYPTNPFNFKKFNNALNDFNSRWNSNIEIEGLIKLPAILHKRRFWTYENEVRLFYEFTEDSVQAYRCFEDNYPIKFDFRSNGDISPYFEFDLYKETPNIEVEIKKIQIGYKQDEFRFEKIKKHIKDIFWAHKLNEKIPMIELSPLRKYLVRS